MSDERITLNLTADAIRYADQMRRLGAALETLDLRPRVHNASIGISPVQQAITTAMEAERQRARDVALQRIQIQRRETLTGWYRATRQHLEPGAAALRSIYERRPELNPVTLAGRNYDLHPHSDGRPGYRCWPTIPADRTFDAFDRLDEILAAAERGIAGIPITIDPTAPADTIRIDTHRAR